MWLAACSNNRLPRAVTKSAGYRCLRVIWPTRKPPTGAPNDLRFFLMTARKKIDALIDVTATQYFEGMTKLERDLALSDATLAGLRVLAKAIDQIHLRLEEINDRLIELEPGEDDEAALDVITGGLSYLRRKVKRMAKQGKSKKKR
jgi:hypothetical protein